MTDSLQQLILHHDLLSHCEKWHTRLIQDNTMEDVYDGQVWKDFMQYDGRPFLSVPHNFAFSLNIDWFQPFQ